MENTQTMNAEVYSANFSTGSRTYFINMLEAKNNSKYVKITESRKVGENEYQKNRIMLFQNDLYKLSRVLNKAIARIKGSNDDGTKEEESLLSGENEENAAAESCGDPQFPNSGKRWTTEDEEKLEFLFKAGKTVEDLTEIFGRKQKGIESRLQKLGLIEQK
ncbi:MAG: DUF3276 family protein [Candidatus Delongbacteria bacterium]|nr:DUF3276 family protein [Candidatus Delongbacteria bacterium]